MNSYGAPKTSFLRICTTLRTGALSCAFSLGGDGLGEGDGVKYGFVGLAGSLRSAESGGKRDDQRSAVRRVCVSASGNGTIWYSARISLYLARAYRRRD